MHRPSRRGPVIGSGSAADRATSLGSPAQALAYAEKALEITLDGSERAALLERAGEAAGLLAKSEQAIAYFDEAIAIRRTEGDLNAAARDVARELISLVETERMEEARTRAEDVLAELGERESPALVELLSGSPRSSGARERPKSRWATSNVHCRWPSASDSTSCSSSCWARRPPRTNRSRGTGRRRSWRAGPRRTPIASAITRPGQRPTAHSASWRTKRTRVWR